MSTDLSSQILNNWTKLTRVVRLKDISGILIQKRVITPAEWEELKDKDCGEAVRMEAFLLKLARKSEAVRKHFVQALKDGPYSHVYKQMSSGKTQVSEDDRLKTLEQQFKQQSKASSDDKRAIGVLQEKVKKIEIINAKIPQLEQQLKDKQKQIQKLQKETSSLLIENGNLQNQVETLSKLSFTRQNTILDIDRERTNLQREVQDLNQRLIEANKEREGLENVKKNSEVCVIL